MGTETNRSMTVRLALELLGTCAERVRTNSVTVAKNMATESAANDQASQEAARVFTLATLRSCCLVPSVTTLLYKKPVSQA